MASHGCCWMVSVHGLTVCWCSSASLNITHVCLPMLVKPPTSSFYISAKFDWWRCRVEGFALPATLSLVPNWPFSMLASICEYLGSARRVCVCVCAHRQATLSSKRTSIQQPAHQIWRFMVEQNRNGNEYLRVFLFLAYVWVCVYVRLSSHTTVIASSSG